MMGNWPALPRMNCSFRPATIRGRRCQDEMNGCGKTAAPAFAVVKKAGVDTRDVREMDGGQPWDRVVM